MMLCLNLSNIAIITVKGAGYCCTIYDIIKSEAAHLLGNSVLKFLGIYKIHIREINIKNSCTITLTI